MKKNYRMKRTISVKMFISEFEQCFSEHIKKRLMDIDLRCVLTRKDKKYVVDIKHVEHIKYNSKSENGENSSDKEYVYGRFICSEDMLYFSNDFDNTNDFMKAEVVDNIYNSMNTEEVLIDEEELKGKQVNDGNIDFIIDSILEVCPDVSQKYLDIVHEMISHSEIKKKNTFHVSNY
ncbi:hypothetical protein H2684_01300 [Clostridium sp. cel8]|uniref:hypothetical protein n=1 Tax=unclassified Clostridium TaxID=2614128 RepID=UPI0015F43EBF|nr:hypothetical protein [Clostridium sp. cel8]MBA5849956.1 hypothetical protein [Clostridium sp. cel8]